jgi:hypothetical protein
VDRFPFQFPPLLFPFMTTTGRNSISTCIDSSHLGAAFVEDAWKPLIHKRLWERPGGRRDRRTVRRVEATSSASSALGLPVPLSVPRAKGEDDQRQAHHYRENADEWR